MSILTGKHIFVIGDETTQISKIEAALITYGATITSISCELTTKEKLEQIQCDLVVINHLHDGAQCHVALQLLQESQLIKTTPVFVLVEHSQHSIADALSMGAADYIVPDEDVHTVVEKMKVVFGEGSSLNDETAIDLTPKQLAGTGKGVRVFAIEDDPLLRNLLAIKFEKSNVPFELDSDGEHIVERIKAFKPHIVILDLMLPGRDGFELLREIRADATITDMPVIIFSNRDTPEDRAAAQELGVKGFYIKALTDLTELMATLEKFAKRQ